MSDSLSLPSQFPLCVRDLGLQPYETVWQSMSQFTNQRDDSTIDELWIVEHEPVFTQGQAGKPEHIIQATDIPIVKSDRGGQVTYHGPGQLILYPLINLRRRKLGVRDMVTLLEQLVIQWLAVYRIESYAKADAPGVYVKRDGNDAKIASLGLRIRRGCSFHGVSINIDMDLTPFNYINPCGYPGLEMTQLNALIETPLPNKAVLVNTLTEYFAQQMHISQMQYSNDMWLPTVNDSAPTSTMKG
ncbi:MAG: lipoyl(octanoyl) transferase [Candidatus Endobugula sp.]|jgi:lipoyl(octanoyl) transferase